jgi:hypothetical protein
VLICVKIRDTIRMRITITFLILTILSSCSHFSKKSQDNSKSLSDYDSREKIVDLEKILNRAEKKADPKGKSILTTGRSMIKRNQIIRGSCWDYANAVYKKAGYPDNARVTPLKSKMKGPYADLSTIQAGDWLYFINHSFKEIDHSGIFIEWTNFENKRGVILSYVGGKKNQPGNYRIYDLKHVYYIIRPK